jgi:hypothetical protein
MQIEHLLDIEQPTVGEAPGIVFPLVGYTVKCPGEATIPGITRGFGSV